VPTCSPSGYLGNNIWFSFVVPSSGEVIISTSALQITDGVFSVYEGNCNNLTEIICVDDSQGTTMPEVNLTGLTPGDVILIRFWGYGGYVTNQVGLFQICVNDPGCCTPVTITGSITACNTTTTTSTTSTTTTSTSTTSTTSTSTTSSTTTSTTSTTSTTTTTTCPCNTYEFVGASVVVGFEFVECGGISETLIGLGARETATYCVSNAYPIIMSGDGSYGIVGNPADCCTPVVPPAPICEDCALALADVTQNAISVLSVGNMASNADTPCVIGDYVIDWYLDSTSNPIEFTSGIGSDPDIDQLHPFTGTAARPSVAGNWIPVIRYIYLDSVKYTSQDVPGGVYIPGLDGCLEPVIVENLNCSNGSDSLYSHSINYQAVIQNPADALRTFRFDLDNVVNYFAWKFTGYMVSDRIQFYYVSGATQTLLGDYAVGDDLSLNLSVPVKQIFGESFREVFDISTIPYVSGDHILVKITSSYGDPLNQNTNWKFECKCLPTFDCSYPATLEIDDCSPVMTYSATECKYTLSYSFLTYPNYNNTDSVKYLLDPISTYENIFSASLPSFGNPNVQCKFNYGTFCGPSILGTNTCVNASSKSLTKVGNVFTITFTDNAEYLIWKNQYNSTYSALIATYNPSNTSINHYKFLVTLYLIDPLGNGCGDTLSSTSIPYHISSVVTFDDINLIMEINVANTTYGLTTTYCNNGCSSIPQIQGVADSIAQPDFSNLQSTVRPAYQGYVTYGTSTSSQDWGNIYQYDQHYLPYGETEYVCDGTPNFCIEPIYPYYPILGDKTVFYRFNHYVEITDITDGVNNFKIQSRVDANGCLITDPNNYITLYEIVNGVVITPAGGCP
jgi:hypothetical protein